MSRFKVRALRAALVVPLLMGSALVASAGHASASINPDNVDRPKISAGDREVRRVAEQGSDPGRRDLWRQQICFLY